MIFHEWVYAGKKQRKCDLLKTQVLWYFLSSGIQTCFRIAQEFVSASDVRSESSLSYEKKSLAKETKN